jgi:hypothetical protein
LSHFGLPAHSRVPNYFGVYPPESFGFTLGRFFNPIAWLYQDDTSISRTVYLSINY